MKRDPRETLRRDDPGGFDGGRVFATMVVILAYAAALALATWWVVVVLRYMGVL